MPDRESPSGPAPPAPVTLFVLAGEPSGDVLGARLVAALKRRCPEGLRIVGVGGSKLAAEGLDSLYPMEDIAHFGAAELLPHLPTILRRIRETVDTVRELRPDAVVTIDIPGFAFRVGKRLAGNDVPLIHYVAPQVWAWKPHRARDVAGFLHHVIALLPFEPPYFEAEGLPCTFVGHPVLESGADRGDGPGFRARHGIAATAPLVCVLPGSRRGEVRRLLPEFAGAVERLAAERPGLAIAIPAVDSLRETIAESVRGWPVRCVVTAGESGRFGAFAAADAALAASGTVALELAMAGTPSVIAYRLNPITGWLIRRAIRVKQVSLVNLLAEDDVFPELLQQDCRADRLAAAVAHLLDDPSARARQANGMARAVSALRADGEAPSEKAAGVVLQVVRERRRRAELPSPTAMDERS